MFINLFTNTFNAAFDDRSYLCVERDAIFNILGTAYITNGCRFTITGELSVGDGTFFNARTAVLCTSTISIGSHCAISWDVTILDTDVHHISYEKREVTAPSKPIFIGDRVWIGAGAKICKGVTVGDGAVIAAQSVVTKDVPAGTLAAGIPARVVKENVTWS
ncbi:MAG: acyltransferase [bacterium]